MHMVKVVNVYINMSNVGNESRSSGSYNIEFSIITHI